MLLKMYIEPHGNGKDFNESFGLTGSRTYASFVKPYEGSSNQNDFRVFTITELKIKYMNENYFFFSENTWFLIKSNDCLIFDQYKIKVDLIPEDMPLPFELDNTVNQPLASYEGLSSHQDPLSFLYGTPAQQLAAIQIDPKESSGHKEGDFTLTFWDLIQNINGEKSIRFDEKPLLLYNSSRTKEDLERY